MKLLIRISSGFSLSASVVRPLSILFLLCGPLAAIAHGPGAEKIDKITAKIQKLGNQSQLYAERARIYQSNQHWQEAMLDFNKAAELDRQNAEYDVERAKLAYEAGEYQIALDFIELYSLRHQDTAEASFIKGRSHRALRQYDKAVAAYQNALENRSSNPERPSPEWYVEYADTLLLTGDRLAALNALQQGIGELGELSVFLLKAIDLEVDLEFYDAALVRLASLIEQSQRKDIWLSRRADILQKAGRPEQALLVYQQAYAALRQLPIRLQNLPISQELASRLQLQIAQN